jgi:hypothetical protein
VDRTAKPVIKALAEVRRKLEALPFDELPPRKIDAICILTAGQDHWGVAYTAFLLAKQAGFDLRFHFGDRSLPEASFYLLPNLNGLAAMSKRLENELWDKVKNGANAYISLGDGILGKFVEATGMTISTRSERRESTVELTVDGTTLKVPGQLRYEGHAATAEVLASDSTGAPMFWKNRFGAGTVYVLASPLEEEVARQREVFVRGGEAFWKIYQHCAEEVLAARVVKKSNPWLGVTEHVFADGRLVAVIINYSREEESDTLRVQEGCKIAEIDRKSGTNELQIALGPSQFLVCTIFQ